MNINIKLTKSRLEKFKEYAEQQLEYIQYKYTKERETYILDFIDNNLKYSGMFWWKSSRKLSRSEAIANLNARSSMNMDYTWYYRHQDVVVVDKEANFLNNILKINTLDELSLSEQEYNWLKDPL